MIQQGVELISVKDIFRYLRRPDIIFVDLRDREEFLQGHIDRAFCLSIEQIENGDFLLAKEYGYVMYCDRGGVSMHAVLLLRDSEVPVYSLAGGMEEYEIFMRSLVDRKRGKL